MDLNLLQTYNPDFNIALTKQSYFGGKEGFIFIIPEVWGNQTFLFNELKLLLELKQRFDVHHFFCEGAFYKYSSAQMKTMVNKSQKELNTMFAAGQLKAQEYLALVSEDAMMLYGADHEDMYNAQNAAYYASREIYTSVSPFFTKVRTLISDTIKKKYPDQVTKIYNDIVRFNAHETFDQEITTFANKLLKFAENEKIEIVFDEKIRKLISAQSEMTRKDLLTGFTGLKQDFINILNNEDPQDDFLKRLFIWQARKEEMHKNKIMSLSYNEIFSLYKRACVNLELLTESAINILEKDALNIEAIEMILSIASITKVEQNKYPQIFEYFHQRVLFDKAIKGSYHILGGIVEESIVEQLLNKIKDNGLLKSLYRFEMDLYSIEKLFKTELVSEKAREIPYLTNKYKFKRILEILNDLGIDESAIQSLWEYGFFWEQNIVRTKRYYDNAFNRSQYMLDYCISEIKGAGTPIGIMMVGGFHEQPIIRSMLRNGDYSFMALQCQTGKISPSGRSDYDKLMDKMNK